ncbi:hypothetical protein RYX36_031710 [Vicia faba]
MSSPTSTNRFDAISTFTISSSSARDFAFLSRINLVLLQFVVYSIFHSAPIQPRHSQHRRVVSLLPMLISDSLNSNSRSKLFDLAFTHHHSSFSALSASPPSLVHILLPTIAFNSQHVLGSFTMKSEMEGNNNTIRY